MTRTTWMRLLLWAVILTVQCPLSEVSAQIKIAGSVYGGGNQGVVDGSTSVTVRAGDLNNVYGGARMANVGGSASVNIDGENASDNIIITNVYGGNDIAGRVGADKGQNDESLDAIIRTSRSTKVEGGKTVDDKFIVVGSMFGGGNGDYDYTSDNSPYKGMVRPELRRTSLEIYGGCIAHLYGGGNNATVTRNTTISIDNESAVLTKTNVYPADPTTPEAQAQLVALAQRMGLSTFQSTLDSYAYNFARVFGGNNKAEMKIRPTWNLKNGIIRDLYSGGNQGAMTSPDGLLLNIDADSKIEVANLYGGCRMADVCPKVDGVYTPTTNIEGYNFPEEFSARVVITGGHIYNVYGGNDISGKVYGGNAVGIRATVYGDVYGGGNGSYAYTDNPELGQKEMFKDFYYDKGSNSVEALNAHRPNAEQVSIRVVGTEDNPTVVHGGIFCGGNNATIMSDKTNPKVELKIGSHVYADSVFLGNNGANMVDKDILEHYAGKVDANGNLTTDGSGTDFSSIDLTDKTTFETYMDGAAMRLMPSVDFDKKNEDGTGDGYDSYTSYFGSFYCGGNVGSMKVPGKITINFNEPIIIYNKVVGGCNNANIYKTNLNAEFLGGLMEAPDDSGNKLELNFNGLKIRPMRWKVKRNDDYTIQKDADGNVTYVTDKGNHQLEWNTVSATTGKEVAPVMSGTGESDEYDVARRFRGGNIYGGCYNNGHINGNVVININETLTERDKLFDETEQEAENDKNYENAEKAETNKAYYNIKTRRSGVILSEQGTDVFASALSVFGGGYGGDSEIWGSATVNLNKGYTFQIFGGGEKGAIGQADNHEEDPNNTNAHILGYTYNPKYSTYVNLNGDSRYPGVARGAKGDNKDMAECEYVYGGAYEGPIAGDAHVYLNNGRIFNSFGGSSNADILGHVETYVGPNGFPYVRDYVYGGNDLGGVIRGQGDFSSKIEAVKDMVYEPSKEQVEHVPTYVEYTQGRVEYLLGGGSGNYDYNNAQYQVKTETAPNNRVISKPIQHNTFVNFHPNANANNEVVKVFGAGEGYPGDREGDKLQDHSYVLVNIPDGIVNFTNTEFFGAGAFNGLGMKAKAEDTFKPEFEPDEASAIVDLVSGKVGAAYGGSYEEGITRRTVVNVPEESTINIKNIFGGAYGTQILPPCDVYESNVYYRNTSEKACVTGAVYGGNNNERRTLYSHVYISSPVWSNKASGYLAKVYGAGKGLDTWAEYTEVNLEAGAKVYEVYGGGEMGHVLNGESVMKYMNLFKEQPSAQIVEKDPKWSLPERWEEENGQKKLKATYLEEWQKDWKTAWTFGDYYVCKGEYFRYASNDKMNLENTHEVRTYAELDAKSAAQLAGKKYNANVIINKGATVVNYAYGGGYGTASVPQSGDVYGSTYITLLGGTVEKDIYASGTSGAVCDLFGVGAKTNDNPGGFTATANAYVKGGMVRNVYGGGWRGSVGYHPGEISDVANNNAADILGETHVVIGDLNGTDFYNGIPAINRNVYGGGEGGGIFGTAYVTVNNGRIGYRYKESAGTRAAGNGQYVEELDDVKAGDNLLDMSGNVFGGGYVANSYVDVSDVKMYGGIIRGCLYGGGEVGPIGRGTVKDGAPAGLFTNGKATIYKGGETHVTLYKGHVMRDVFGGGRGFDNWNGEGYMTAQEKATMDLSSKGYVFGQTEVNIFGGEVGTDAGIADGYGNVFGGGNVGYVYSAKGNKPTETELAANDKLDPDYYYDEDGHLTNDCSVTITPYCQVKPGASVRIGDETYGEGDFVPASELDKLQNKAGDARWNSLDIDGVIVRNAVFAGGNVTIGDNEVYANAKTVLGNVSANVVDIYNRDLVTVGTEHVGGLYGDGNLTLVDGYRELNISNYGTDYYSMSETISIDEYLSLTDRERAYFALEYVCINPFTMPTSTGDKHFQQNERLSEEKYEALDDQYKSNFKLYGFCSIYAGRLMNTIQRADFCGIFGSRLVMQGAKDRVPSVADKTDYTVNRVGEVSLNQVTTIAGELETDVNYKHGNYFGIYSVVNHMGALTSDVDFYETVRTTDNTSEALKPDGSTFYEWKEKYGKKRSRNNGKVANSVALASGVYLELTTEESTPDNKVWGLITGVAQLELINVKTGLGGGYVYAKNEHGVRTTTGNDQTILSPYNLAIAGSHKKAVTNKRYTYSTDDGSKKEVQTSGNFVHNLKQIIDDCYPTINAYKGSGAAPAHYWFIRGTSYVYDQYITAYTGVSNAYSKLQKIPLNINASSYGKMKLEDVKVNLYAYYATTDMKESDRKPLQNTDENAEYYSVLVNNDKTYHLNDTITYWDWLQLSESDQRHFVADTYVTIAECKLGNTTYPKGTVLLPDDYQKLKASAPLKEVDGETVPAVYHVEKEENVDFDFVFRRSNNLAHDLGYVVTYAVNNPKAWDTQDPNCTYSPKTTGVYGQRYYDIGEIIDKSTYDDYENMGAHKPADTDERPQAKMADAYVTKEDVTFTEGGKTYNFIAGTPLCEKEYPTAWASIQSSIEPARVCIGTLEFEGADAKKSMLFGEVVTTDRFNEVVAIYKEMYKVSEEEAKKEVNAMLSKAYICYEDGYYGGGYFEAGQKYSALKAWSSLSAEDREKFTFNYDALNLLIDPKYSGNTKLYDGNREPYTYSTEQPIDYEAVYTGSSPLTVGSQTITEGQIISREAYEAIPNEQYHYSPVLVDDEVAYVVNSPFMRGDAPYTAGQVITEETYSYLTDDQKSHVTELLFDATDKGQTYYYCRSGYDISTAEGHAVKDVLSGKTINPGGYVEPGALITESNYSELTNLQKNFTIQGDAPEELTTLYVAAQSDLYDLQKDRIISVIFSYDYMESDESGTHIEPVSERHIVNIHIHFESGVPDIGTLRTPPVALPGDYVGLYQPTVKPGAYEIMGGGWELFQNEEDAERHRNGVEFNNRTPVYWYQDGQYVAYYAKTYLGKTYSNPVAFNVANYHDLKEVMNDENHLYIDHPDVKRGPKIYINDYSGDDKSGADLLKDLYDYSKNADNIQELQNTEVFFHADTEPKEYAGNDWTSIASGTDECYAGTIHGEGHHVDGLTSSLIGHLCGHVYNLGVQGSFTSAGLADDGDGYVENCWAKTTGTPDGRVYAVFGDPSDDSEMAWRQIENCYYAVGGGNYKTTDATHGLARQMTEQQFYNGEVAYNLNAYYLKERYNRQASANDKVETYGYVEDRYKNVDFLYANGEIPTDDDARLKTDADGNRYYEPIWPDDYLFFGQSLTGGYEFTGAGTEEEVPSSLKKTGDCNTLENNMTSNRVYRTPAYFGSKKMGLYHFNPYAILAAKSADGKHDMYPGMTAVDFMGYNDKGYSTGLDTDGIFYAPICDADMTLAGVANADETRNLLVYSPQADTDNGAVLAAYFTEPQMSEKDDDATTGMRKEYRAVTELTDGDVGTIHGHVIYHDADGFYALTDQILVDRQDFNCPMSYTLGSENRMWYQRKPDNYVDARTGWEAISLPFSAELVTTPDKGEITHFYQSSTTGHEYWLREFKGGEKQTGEQETVFVGNFVKPEDGTAKKYYTNTFLWDHYYSFDNYWDQNKDDYQKTYYQDEHVYSNYPYNAVAKPYIVGFPGGRYYEFDLSGTFVPNYTNSPMDRMAMQPIIFVSEPGIKIAVSDDELAEASVAADGYRFVPNYINRTLSTAGEGYVMAADGGSFDKNAEGAVLEAFRPYFIGTNGTRGGDVDRIIFGDDNTKSHPNEDLSKKDGAGTLTIYAKKDLIIVESSLSFTEDVRIVTPAGITVAAFAVKPGQTVEVRADFSGMYIAHTLDGKYTRKVMVRK